MITAREEILSKLKATQDRREHVAVPELDQETPIYHPLGNSLLDDFKKNLELVAGNVYAVKSLAEVDELVGSILKKKEKDRVYCTDPVLTAAINSVKIESGEENFLSLNVGMTRCEFLVAHLGSVIISSGQVSGRRLNVYPETHIVVAHSNQLTGYLDEAIVKLQEKYKDGLPSLITNITGPSRTADIEKTLVMGMHGPKNLIVVVTEQPF